MSEKEYEKYFFLTGYDPATPSFITSEITYLCTQEQIKKYSEKDTEGDNPLTHNIENALMPLEIRPLIKYKTYPQEGDFNFVNIWDHEVLIRFKELNAKFVYFQYKDVFYRFYYVSMKNAYYTAGEHKRYISSNWGNKVVRNNTNLFGFNDIIFNNEEEMLRDYHNPKMVDLNLFFFDIFADG